MHKGGTSHAQGGYELCAQGVVRQGCRSARRGGLASLGGAAARGEAIGKQFLRPPLDRIPIKTIVR
jgi:hypothetical protein